MTSIFVDESGSPIVDAQGNILFVDGELEIGQRITNLLRTIVYSELLFPEYGFDVEAVIQAPGYVDRSVYIKSLLMTALNPQFVLGLSSVDSILVEVEDNIVKIDLIVTMTDGKTYAHNLNVSLGDE